MHRVPVGRRTHRRLGQDVTRFVNPPSLIKPIQQAHTFTAEVSEIDMTVWGVGDWEGQLWCIKRFEVSCLSTGACRMLPRRMLWGAVARQIAPRLTYSTATQPQVGLLSHCNTLWNYALAQMSTFMYTGMRELLAHISKRLLTNCTF